MDDDIPEAPKKARVVLLDEQHTDDYEHLVSVDSQDFDQQVTMQKEERIEEDQADIAKTHEEIPKEDFFEGKVEQTPEYYGEIEGMSAVTPDEDETPKPSKDHISFEPSKEEIRRPSEDVSQISGLARPLGSVSSVDTRVTEGDESRRYSDYSQHRASRDSQQGELTDSQRDDLRDSQRDDSRDSQAIPGRRERAMSDAPPLKSGPPSTLASRTASVSSERRESEKRGTVVAPPRQSIHYDLASRIDSSEHELDQFFDLGKQDDFFFMDEFAEAVEEESEHATIEEESMLDREPYYDKYMRISEEIVINRMKNNFLQKLVTMYLKRRKVENFSRDGEPPLDQLNKYGQKLDAYQELMGLNKNQRDSLSIEVNTLKQKREKKCKELKALFKSMQTREANVGFGLIYSKTGNTIPEKLVERFLRRQSTQIEQVSSMRLKYIKLKGMVQEKLNAIDQLDILENNLHLSDFEQLKAENRSFADKIEEREEELTRLRFKCQNTIQVLAHMREKSSALDSDVMDLTEDFYSVDNMARDLRGDLANLKHSRDKYRQMERSLKEESGLLTHPDLLMDMEQSQNEITHGEMELIKYKEETITKAAAVRTLRKNMERLTETANRRKANRYKSRKKSLYTLAKKSNTDLMEEVNETTIYSGRPTLYMPTIKSQVFEDLVKIRPSPQVFSKKK